MMGANGGAIASRIAGCGLLMRMMAICGVGVSTFSTGANMAWNGWLALIVMIEKATSSLVMGLPSWNVAPARSFSSSALAVVLEAPAFGQVGLGVPVLVEAQRAGEDLRRRDPGGHARLHGRVEVPRRAGRSRSPGCRPIRLARPRRAAAAQWPA
jgi:hypothetical protein